jgi:hypothetical protein
VGAATAGESTQEGKLLIAASSSGSFVSLRVARRAATLTMEARGSFTCWAREVRGLERVAQMETRRRLEYRMTYDFTLELRKSQERRETESKRAGF